jgi:hypothetical protein
MEQVSISSNSSVSTHQPLSYYIKDRIPVAYLLIPVHIFQ